MNGSLFSKGVNLNDFGCRREAERFLDWEEAEGHARKLRAELVQVDARAEQLRRLIVIQEDRTRVAYLGLISALAEPAASREFPNTEEGAQARAST